MPYVATTRGGTIAIHFTHVVIIATINSAIQLHIRRLRVQEYYVGHDSHAVT